MDNNDENDNKDDKDTPALTGRLLSSSTGISKLKTPTLKSTFTKKSNDGRTGVITASTKKYKFSSPEISIENKYQNTIRKDNKSNTEQLSPLFFDQANNPINFSEVLEVNKDKKLLEKKVNQQITFLILHTNKIFLQL